MPFKSKAQQRLFFAKEERGELPKGKAREWAHKTPNIKKLPERVKESSLIADRVLWKLSSGGGGGGGGTAGSPGSQGGVATSTLSTEGEGHATHDETAQYAPSSETRSRIKRSSSMRKTANQIANEVLWKLGQNPNKAVTGTTGGATPISPVAPTPPKEPDLSLTGGAAFNRRPAQYKDTGKQQVGF